MKIAFLVPTSFALDGPGRGVRVQAAYQARALTELGHEVVLLDPWQVYDFENFDVMHYFMGGFQTFNVENAPLPGRVVRVFSPMIDSNEPNWRYRLAAWIGSIHPKIYTIPSVLREQSNKADAVIARSTHELERLNKGLGIPATKLKLVLNGVNPPRPADPARGRQIAGWDEPFVLHVSLYSQDRKNVANLIKAVGPLGLKLAIVGHAMPGPILDEITQLAANYSNVRLMGYQTESDLNSLYAACRVFCLPSVHEGTGLAALEAASYGAAIVITRNGGPRDYFANLADYVDPNSISNIAAAIQRAWDRPPSDKLRNRILSTMTWKHSAQKLEAVYRACAKRS